MVEIEKLGLILVMVILTTTAIPYTRCPYIRSIAKFQLNWYVVYKENSFTRDYFQYERVKATHL